MTDKDKHRDKPLEEYTLEEINQRLQEIDAEEKHTEHQMSRLQEITTLLRDLKKYAEDPTLEAQLTLIQAEIYHLQEEINQRHYGFHTTRQYLRHRKRDKTEAPGVADD